MSRFNVRRAVAATTLSVLACSTLAACGSDDDNDNANDGNDNTSQTDGGDADNGDTGGDTDLLGRFGAVSEPDEFLDLYEAAYSDATTAKMSMEMTAGGQAITAEGDVDYSSEPVSMQMTMDMGAQGSMEMIMVGTSIYMGGEFVNQIAPQGGVEWLKMDLDDPTLQGMGLNADSITQGFDPQAMTAMMEKALTSVEFRGEEEVDGETLLGYDIEMDPAVVLEEMGMAESPAAGELPESIAYTVWFDEDEHVRQMDMDMTSVDPSAGTVVMKMYDYGTDVDITEPDPSTVQDFADLMSGLGAGAGAGAGTDSGQNG